MIKAKKQELIRKFNLEEESDKDNEFEIGKDLPEFEWSF